jgi:sugar-specific transcriptional regulator TrmB
LTAKEIAVKLSFSKGSVSGTLSALEKKGYVKKNQEYPARYFSSGNQPKPEFENLISDIRKRIEDIKNQQQDLKIEEEKLTTALETIKSYT